MRKIFGSIYFLVAVYIFLAFIAFGRLPFAFFQQDEWAIIGTFIYFDKTNLSWFERLFTYGPNTHTIPLSGILSYFEYKLAGLNFSYYAYFSIAMHSMNVFLVFYLAYLFFKKKLPAFIAGFVFLVDFIPSQGITWIATTSATAGATAFTLFSLIYLTKFLLYKNKNIFVVLSLVFLFVSLLFKESSFFMFLFIPVYWLVFNYKKNDKHSLNFLIALTFVGGLYILPRLLLATTPSVSDGLAHPSILDYLYRIITFPVKAISQSVIPSDFIRYIADRLVTISQSLRLDLLSYFFTLIILILCVWLYKKAIKNNMPTYAHIIIISVIFIALSVLPLIFIPGNSGYFSFFDGRYLYMGAIFKSILFANIFFFLYSFLGRKKIIIFSVLFFAFFTIFNILSIRNSLEIEIVRGEERKSILNQIQASYAKLPKNVVFYTESDTSYYGLPIEEKIMPFYSGFGQTLLVWYEGKGEDFPACFFKDKYLYAIIEEGYKECEGRGYGYFRKFDSLKTAILKYSIDPKNVISFSHIAGDEKLVDTSLEIREKLKSEK